MSTQHGGAEASGASPAEPTVGTEPVEPVVAGEAVEPAAAGEPAEPTAERDAQIAAAGGSVLGESQIAARADRTQVRRAPRYKRFAVLGGLVGVLIAAIATPLASYDSTPAEVAPVSPTGLFLLLLTILVPVGILVSCAVAMFSDRAARVPPRTKRTKRMKKARR